MTKVIGSGLSWMARLFAIASLLVVGKSEAWGAQRISVDSEKSVGATLDGPESAAVTYVEIGDASGEDDDNPPKPE